MSYVPAKKSARIWTHVAKMCKRSVALNLNPSLLQRKCLVKGNVGRSLRLVVKYVIVINFAKKLISVARISMNFVDNHLVLICL